MPPAVAVNVTLIPGQALVPVPVFRAAVVFAWTVTVPLPEFVQLVTVGHTLTLSPNLVVDGNIGFTRMSEYGQTPDFGTNIGSDVLGIPGTNNGADLRSSGFPYFAVSGYAHMGNPEGWNPAFRNDWSFTTSHNVRWSHSKHQVSAGIDIIHHLRSLRCLLCRSRPPLHG